MRLTILTAVLYALWVAFPAERHVTYPAQVYIVTWGVALWAAAGDLFDLLLRMDDLLKRKG